MAKATSKSKKIIGIILISFLFLLFLNNFINFSYAQNSDNSYSIPNKFQIFEFTEFSDTLLNKSSIDIDLPSSTWNISSIELNFTNIELEKEIIEVETEDSGSKNLNKQKPAYAVQINNTGATFISAVEIKGNLGTPSTTTNITVQINGYNPSTNTPNNTIYGSTILNISTDIGWYIQTFPTPIYLPEGNYFLVLNGTGMEGTGDTGKYYWFFNDFNPNNPNLYTAEWNMGWNSIGQGSPFLYKLYKKEGIKLNPEDINMTAEINGNTYMISNSTNPGSGNLTIHNLNFPPGGENWNIPIRNNQSFDLIFNVSYGVKIHNIFFSIGSVLIEENQENIWKLTPVISRKHSYYYIKIPYPKSWYNLTIYRDIGFGWENITIDVINDPFNHFLLIDNNTIIEGSDWKITANSPNIDFEVDFRSTEWEPGQTLQFSVLSPIMPGNITVIIENPLGYTTDPEVIEVQEITTEDIVYSYEIPSSSRKGIYIAYIYWNNATDAGVVSQEFQLIVPPAPKEPLHPLVIIGIVLLAIGISAFSIVPYRTIKKYRTRKIEEEQKTFSKCMDIMNLDYIIVTNKRSGLSVYEQKFTSKELNGTLISGFLQALSSFGIELMKVENQSQTIKLEYKDSIVLMSEFVNIRLILIMKESPSRYLLYSLEDLAYDTYKNYGTKIDQFNGDVRQFKGIEDLLIKHLNVSIVYPLKLVNIDNLEKIRISPTEKSVINNVISIMKKGNTDSFYIKELIPEKSCSPKDVEIILKLIEKNIFQVVN